MTPIRTMKFAAVELRSIRCSGTKYVSTFCDRRQGCGSVRPIAAERNEETIGWASVLMPNLVLKSALLAISTQYHRHSDINSNPATPLRPKHR